MIFKQVCIYERWETGFTSDVNNIYVTCVIIITAVMRSASACMHDAFTIILNLLDIIIYKTMILRLRNLAYFSPPIPQLTKCV